jgi:Helitron helicase-like domain at N-terminus
MDLECPVCGALHFKDERASGTNLRNPEFSLCCNRGKVELPYLRDPPTLLQRLLGSYKDLPEHRRFPVTRAQETQGVAFRDEIRKYNSAMAFASLGVKIDGNVTGAAGGPYSFRINGQLHHKIGALLPEVSIKLWLCYLAEGMNIQDGQPPQYAQIYIHDGDHATIRRNRNPNTEREIFSDLEAMLMEHNPFIHDFKTAHERLLNTPADQQEVRCRITLQGDPRRYNEPVANEVAAIVPGNGAAVDSCRDIILFPRQFGRPLTRISEIHMSYTPFVYVLLCVYGEVGWHPRIPLRGAQLGGIVDDAHQLDEDDEDENDDGEDGRPRRRKQVRLTQSRWFAFRISPRRILDAVGGTVRRLEPTTILRAGRLLQQFVVDGWASCQQNNLNWIRHNQVSFMPHIMFCPLSSLTTFQSTIRAELYSGIVDAHMNGDDLADVGQRVVLPSSFQGSDRFMGQLFQDTMAINRCYGAPTYFITVTANPNWREVTNNLLPGQKPADRPDLIARIFRLRLKQFIKDISTKAWLGKVIAKVYVIEFQKRGLPHAHILFWLNDEDKPRDPDDIDCVISAQIPDPTLHPNLYHLVTSTMIHECSATRCLNNPEKECSKGFPRDFQEQTAFVGQNGRGYPIYARPNNGRSFTNGRGNVFTNQHVVPYNPWLLRYFGAHVNMEFCASMKGGTKYIHKYITKGADQATWQVGADEINLFLDARYIGAPEAVWRIFHFPIHLHTPTIYRLHVHLPNQHLVRFEEGANIEEVIANHAGDRTMLTAWFQVCQLL